MVPYEMKVLFKWTPSKNKYIELKRNASIFFIIFRAAIEGHLSNPPIIHPTITTTRYWWKDWKRTISFRNQVILLRYIHSKEFSIAFILWPTLVCKNNKKNILWYKGMYLWLASSCVWEGLFARFPSRRSRLRRIWKGISRFLCCSY